MSRTISIKRGFPEGLITSPPNSNESAGRSSSADYALQKHQVQRNGVVGLLAFMHSDLTMCDDGNDGGGLGVRIVKMLGGGTHAL